MIASDHHEDLPPALRRRLGIPAPSNYVVQAIVSELFAATGEYTAFILRASEGKPVDPAEVLAAANRIGKPAWMVHRDLHRAVAAFDAWKSSVDP
jgi:hypothetical protein